MAWGGVGNPIRVLAGVTGLARARPQRHDRADPAAALGDPAALAGAEHGRLARDAARSGRPWPSAASRSRWLQFYWSNYQESGLVDIVAALVSLLAMVAFLKVWRPADDPRPRPDRPDGRRRCRDRPATLGLGAVLKGWSPFLLASVFIFVWAHAGRRPST